MKRLLKKAFKRRKKNKEVDFDIFLNYSEVPFNDFDGTMYYHSNISKVTPRKTKIHVGEIITAGDHKGKRSQVEVWLIIPRTGVVALKHLKFL